MKILFSAFTGYNARELLLPLVPLLNQDSVIDEVVVVTPAVQDHQRLLPDLKEKYTFIAEQQTQNDYQKVLAKQKPHLVITPTAGLEPRDIPLLNAAKQCHIPTLTFIASWDNVYKMERRIKLKKYQQEYALADHFAVWNKMNYDHLLKIAPHLQPEQITITGPPRLDLLANSASLPSRQDVHDRLHLQNDGKKLIHIATTELYSSDYLVKTLASLDAHLLVSVHPGGDKETHRQYVSPYNATVFYSFGRKKQASSPDFIYAPTLADIRLHAALFKHTDVLINHSSTVTIESLLADTPVINVKYGRPLDWWRWHRSMVYRDFKQHARIIVESGATTVVHNRNQLLTATRSYLQNPNQGSQKRHQLATKMVTYTDGTAGQRMLALIKQRADVDKRPGNL